MIDALEKYQGLLDRINQLRQTPPFRDAGVLEFTALLQELSHPNQIQGIQFLHQLMDEVPGESFSPSIFISDYEALIIRQRDDVQEEVMFRDRSELNQTLQKLQELISKDEFPDLVVLKHRNVSDVVIKAYNKSPDPRDLNLDYQKPYEIIPQKNKQRINGESVYVFAVKFTDPLKDELNLKKADKPISPRYTLPTVIRMIQDRALYRNYIKAFEDLPIDHRRIMMPVNLRSSLSSLYKTADKPNRRAIIDELVKLHSEFRIIYPWVEDPFLTEEEHYAQRSSYYRSHLTARAKKLFL